MRKSTGKGKHIGIKQQAIANEGNGINPLNRLEFDVNTLIPQEEFNWEVIEGMDQIHESVMKSYGKLASDVSRELAKVEERVAITDANITGSFERQLADAETTVNTADGSMLAQLESSLLCLKDEYGNCVSNPSWYLVIREVTPGSTIWVMEKASSPPQDREWYGPFKDSVPLLYASNAANHVLPSRLRIDCEKQQSIMNDLITLYTQAIETMEHYYPGQFKEGTNYFPGSGKIYDENFNFGLGLNAIPCGNDPPIPPFDPCAGSPIGGYPYGTPVACPEGIICSALGRDSNGKAYYVKQGTIERVYMPCYDAQESGDPPVYPPYDPPTYPPYEPPLPPKEPPVNPPIYPPNYPPPVVCSPDIVINPPVCPPSTVTNVTNNYEGKEEDNSSFDKLITALQSCCDNITEALKGKSGNGGSGDLEYLYSDAGQARIDTFLENSGLTAFDSEFPLTLGDSVTKIKAKLNMRP